MTPELEPGVRRSKVMTGQSEHFVCLFVYTAVAVAVDENLVSV